MSFSSGVKDELARISPESRKLRLAELTAVVLFNGRLHEEEGELCLSVSSEHAGIVRKYFTSVKNEYKIRDSLCVLQRPSVKRGHVYSAVLRGRKAIEPVLEDLGLILDAPEKEIRAGNALSGYGVTARRAFLRGAFMAVGSLSDPERSYHLEFVCQSREKAELLRELLLRFGMDAGIVARKRSEVVYLKDSEEIVEILGLMEASSALMELENIRILKEMRNSVNRQVNCEAANISKTVSAAVKQLEDIAYIRDTAGLDSLPGNLREMAEVRLRYPDAALKELGEHLNPPVGKSGVNHRLRKLSEYAGELRGAKVC